MVLVINLKSIQRHTTCHTLFGGTSVSDDAEILIHSCWLRHVSTKLALSSQCGRNYLREETRQCPPFFLSGVLASVSRFFSSVSNSVSRFLSGVLVRVLAGFLYFLAGLMKYYDCVSYAVNHFLRPFTDRVSV